MFKKIYDQRKYYHREEGKQEEPSWLKWTWNSCFFSLPICKL